MELTREVRFSLPRHVNINRISYHVKLSSGLDSPMGETHLLSHNGRLVVLTRNNMSDSLRPVGMSPAQAPRLLHEEWQDVLLLRGAQNQRYRIPLSNAVVGPVAFLLEDTKGAPPETLDGEPEASNTADPDEESDEAGDEHEVTAESALPPLATNEPTPDLEIVPTDPDSVFAGVAAYLRSGRLQLASSWARTIPELSLYHAPEAEEVIRVIDALTSGEPAEAFLRAELADFIRVEIHDAAMRPAAEALAQQGELVWAGAALSAALEDIDEIRRAQVFRRLGKDAAREEHADWLLSELERQRPDYIAEKILQNRGDCSWRELRARLASRRGGHALALRELKLLSERFAGQASIEAARLRALWDSHQRPLFERLLAKCERDFYDDPRGLMHIARVAKDMGASAAQLAPFVNRLVELAPQDVVARMWQAELNMGSSGSTGMWLAVGAGGVAVVTTLIFLL